ncbi:phage antirepressor N-terminal domain-containing protein [Acinetobacter soli]
MNSLTQINAPFNGAQLLIVDFNHQPYVPMKPIVEGMGLAWQAQFDKLKQRFASTIMEIMTIANDGKERSMICLPLRKLPAWLYSVHSNKVKPELRDKVIMYQNECDDVLWDYWMKGQISKQHQLETRIKINNRQIAELKAIVDRR